MRRSYLVVLILVLVVLFVYLSLDNFCTFNISSNKEAYNAGEVVEINCTITNPLPVNLSNAWSILLAVFPSFYLKQIFVPLLINQSNLSMEITSCMAVSMSPVVSVFVLLTMDIVFFLLAIRIFKLEDFIS